MFLEKNKQKTSPFSDLSEYWKYLGNGKLFFSIQMAEKTD